MDYATYLNGTAKEELDHLNKLAGRFHLDSCDLLIDGDGKPPFDVDDWEQVKDYLRENLEDDTAGGMVNFMDETEDFSIVEKEENGRRFWLVSDVDDKKKYLLSNPSSWEETNSERIQRQDFIEDGKLVHVSKKAKEIEGKLEIVMDLYVSFTADKHGNVIRHFIYCLPNKNIKITIVMCAYRCVCER